MTTIQERMQKIKEYDSKVIPLELDLTHAKTLDQQKAAINKYVSASEPLLKMYTDDLNEIINPVSNLSVVILLAALKTVVRALHQQFPEAVGLSDLLLSTIGCNTIKVSREDLKKAQEE